MTDGKMDESCVLAIMEYIDSKDIYYDVHHRCHEHGESSQCDIEDDWNLRKIKAYDKVMDICGGEEVLKGLAFGMSPEDFDQEQLRKGTKIELEHTTDPMVAQRIAMDHLVEYPDYYVELERMEERLEKKKRKVGD